MSLPGSCAKQPAAPPGLPVRSFGGAVGGGIPFGRASRLSRKHFPKPSAFFPASGRTRRLYELSCGPEIRRTSGSAQQRHRAPSPEGSRAPRGRKSAAFLVSEQVPYRAAARPRGGRAAEVVREDSAVTSVGVRKRAPPGSQLPAAEKRAAYAGAHGFPGFFSVTAICHWTLASGQLLY
jgi:hypothetical protein